MPHTARRFRTAARGSVLAAALLLTSCAGGGSAAEEPAPAGPAFLYLTSDPIGQNAFLSTGKRGIEAAARTFSGTARTLEASDDSTRRANLEAAVAEAPELIVMIGASFAEPARAVAEKNPQQRFLLVDSSVTGAPENLYHATFREHEAAYLLGVEAGRLSETHRVGSVVAEDTPLLRKYALAFAAGAQRADAQVVAAPTVAIATPPAAAEGDPVSDAPRSPYADPERGAELATALARDTVDQVFAVAAQSNEGILGAVAERGISGYGVDVNQCGVAPGHVVDGTLKFVDTAIETVVGEIMSGKSSSETTVSFGLAEAGMSLVSLTPDAADSECTIMEHPEILREVTALRDEIIAGTLKIPNPAA